MGKGGEDAAQLFLYTYLSDAQNGGCRKRSPPASRHEVPKHLDKSRSGAPIRRYDFKALISDNFEPWAWPFNVAHANAVFQRW